MFRPWLAAALLLAVPTYASAKPCEDVSTALSLPLADPIAANQTANLEGSGIVPVDWKVDARLSISAFAQGSPVEIQLLDEKAGQFESTFHFPRLPNILMTYQIARAGIYCIKLDATGPVSVSASAMPPELDRWYSASFMESAPYDGFRNPYLISRLEQPLELELETNGLTYWVKIELEDDKTVSIETKTLSDFGDPKIAVFKEDGALVETLDDQTDGALDPKLTLRLEAGNYWLGLRQAPSRTVARLKMTVQAAD